MFIVTPIGVPLTLLLAVANGELELSLTCLHKATPVLMDDIEKFRTTVAVVPVGTSADIISTVSVDGPMPLV
jgi:hypothetical protein